MELENIVANTVYLKAREAADGMLLNYLISFNRQFVWQISNLFRPQLFNLQTGYCLFEHVCHPNNSRAKRGFSNSVVRSKLRWTGPTRPGQEESVLVNVDLGPGLFFEFVLECRCSTTEPTLFSEWNDLTYETKQTRASRGTFGT